MSYLIGVLLVLLGVLQGALSCSDQPISVGTVVATPQINERPVTNCTWNFVAPVGKRIKFQCDKFKVGISSCSGIDGVTVDGTEYCGLKDGLSLVSKSVTLQVKTVASGGGRLTCTATAIKDPCACGRRKTALQTLIVNGTNAVLHEFPYQAALVDSSGNIECGATIIDENYVMTAAHCVVGKTPADIRVLVGEHDTSTAADTSFTQTLTALDIIVHENYNSLTAANDIALVRTKITLNENVDVVCLPWVLRDQTFPMDPVTAAGWGTTEFGGPKSRILQKVGLTTISNQECVMQIPNLVASSLCTLTPNKDTCQYDSGNSLFYQNPSSSRVYSVGVVSGGFGCAGSKPSINTRVTSYLDWIRRRATGAVFCSV